MEHNIEIKPLILNDRIAKLVDQEITKVNPKNNSSSTNSIASKLKLNAKKPVKDTEMKQNVSSSSVAAGDMPDGMKIATRAIASEGKSLNAVFIACDLQPKDSQQTLPQWAKERE